MSDLHQPGPRQTFASPGGHHPGVGEAPGGLHPDADQLSAFVEHALPAQEQGETLAHLAACQACRSVVFLAQQASVQDLPATSTASASRRLWWKGWRLAFPAAAALACLTLLTVHLHNTSVRTAAAPQASIASLQPEPSPPPSAPPGEGNTPAAINPPSLPATASRPQEKLPIPGPAALGRVEERRSQRSPEDFAPDSNTKGEQAAPSDRTRLFAGQGAVPLRAVRPSPASIHGSMNSTLDGVTHDSTAEPADENLHAAIIAAARPAIGPLSRNSEPPLTATGALGRAVPLQRQTIANAASAPITSHTPAPMPAAPAPPPFLPVPAQPLLSAKSASETVSVNSEIVQVVAQDPVAERTPTDQLTRRSQAAQLPQAFDLPSHLPTRFTASSGARTLAVDTQGNLFLSTGASGQWQPVATQWSGRIVSLHLVAPPAPGPQGASREKAKAATAAPHSTALPPAQPSRFELITGSGARWSSPDGFTWTQP